MVDKDKYHDLLAEKRTHLAEKRTELAYERTVMSYLRTAATIILFGIAFIGFSKAKYDFFYDAGWTALIAGILFTMIAIVRGIKHSNEIRKIQNFFENVIEYRFKK